MVLIGAVIATVAGYLVGWTMMKILFLYGELQFYRRDYQAKLSDRSPAGRSRPR